MSVIVERFPGDNPGPDIVDALLVTQSAKIERGTADIDYHCSDRKMMSGNGPKNFFMAPGKLVQVTDGEEVTRGILQSYSRNYNLSKKGFTVTSAIVIEIEAQV